MAPSQMLKLRGAGNCAYFSTDTVRYIIVATYRIGCCRRAQWRLGRVDSVPVFVAEGPGELWEEVARGPRREPDPTSFSGRLETKPANFHKLFLDDHFHWAPIYKAYFIVCYQRW